MAIVSTSLGRAWTWWRRGGWYFAVVLGSFGILSPIPYAHAATWLRDARLWAWTALYATGVATVFVLADAAPKDATGRPEGGLLTTVQVLLTLAVDGAVPPAAQRPPRARRLPEPHRADVESAHPVRELGIGRPDLRRGYDDGGLVELNTAPAAVIAHLCDLPRVVAARSSAPVSTASAR